MVVGAEMVVLMVVLVLMFLIRVGMFIVAVEVVVDGTCTFD